MEKLDLSMAKYGSAGLLLLNLRSLLLYINFRIIYSNSVENVMGILIGIKIKFAGCVV